MKIFITGAAGYIGGHICVELLRAGHDVFSFDNYSSGSLEILERVEQIAGRQIEAVEGDIRSPASIQSALSHFSPDAVIHLAGLKSVRESVCAPQKYFDTNVAGTVHLLKAMVSCEIRQLVFSSSASVYSESNYSPMHEEMACVPYNPYGESKLIGEQMMRQLGRCFPDMSMISLRYFNPVGAHESGLIGELSNVSPNNLAPAIVQVAAGLRPTLDIYGNDWPTKDGTGERDYIHVVDLAAGHIRALEWGQFRNGFEVINLGAGRSYSVLDMIRAFETVTGHEIPRIFRARRSGDIASYFASTEKAKELLGWTAERSLGDMARDAWRWQQFNRARV